MGRVPVTQKEEEEEEGARVGQNREDVGTYHPPATPVSPVQQVVGGSWTTGLFDCHEHLTNAVMTGIFPCATFGQIAEVLDQGKTTCAQKSFIHLLLTPLCLQWIMESKYRKKLRKKYNLVEAPYTDDVSHICCSCCALSQEFRELKNRGLDPYLGWDGILAQQQQREYQLQPPNAPPPNQFMPRVSDLP